MSLFAGGDEGRYRRIARAAFSALAGKGVAVLVSFAAVPLSVGYLGPERYGAWIAVSTLLAWFELADLGIGNALTNRLSESLARGNTPLAKEQISTGFCVLAGFSVVLGVLGAAAWPWLDWPGIFNVRDPEAARELGPAVAAALSLFVCNFPLSLLDRIYAACQEGTLGNYWSAAGNVASLGALVFATRTQGGMVALVLAHSGARLVVQAANAAWLFRRHCPALSPAWSQVSTSAARSMVTTSSLYFLIQIAAVILFNTDNLIIAKILGAERVTPYSVSWRLFTLPTLLVSLFFPYLWPAYVEAFARRDSRWIARTFRLSVAMSLSVSALVVVPLVLLGARIISLWAGEVAVPPGGVLAWMGVWAIILAPSQAVACLLNGAGRLKGQVVYGMAAALVNVALSVLLARSYGLAGVIAATVIAWLACGAVPAALEAASLMAHLKRETMEGEP